MLVQSLKCKAAWTYSILRATTSVGLTISRKEEDSSLAAASSWQVLSRALHQLKNRHTLQMVDRFMYIDCTTQINHSRWRSQHQNDKDQLCFQETSPDNLGAPWDIKLAAQQGVYHAAVLPTLLAACETKTVYRRHSPLTHNFCARDQVAG